jgi:hypothetical protein
MSPPPRDNRFLAVRSAAQEAADFELPDSAVERFIELRDSGADPAAIAQELGVGAEVTGELIAADESYTVAHRIATGQERMYPVPAPDEQVVDARMGSSTVPIIVLIAVLVAVVIYGLLR